MLYPIMRDSYATLVRLRTNSGRAFTVRAVTHTDTQLLTNMLTALSVNTNWLRFQVPIQPLPATVIQREVARLMPDDRQLHVALLATAHIGGGEQSIATAQWVRDNSHDTVAEVAIVVRDDYQRDGVGTRLLAVLAETARRAGITTFCADTLVANTGARQLMRKLGLPATAVMAGSELRLHVPLPGEAYPRMRR